MKSNILQFFVSLSFLIVSLLASEIPANLERVLQQSHEFQGAWFSIPILEGKPINAIDFKEEGGKSELLFESEANSTVCNITIRFFDGSFSDYDCILIKFEKIEIRNFIADGQNWLIYNLEPKVIELKKISNLNRITEKTQILRWNVSAEIKIYYEYASNQLQDGNISLKLKFYESDRVCYEISSQVTWTIYALFHFFIYFLFIIFIVEMKAVGYIRFWIHYVTEGFEIERLSFLMQILIGTADICIISFMKPGFFKYGVIGRFSWFIISFFVLTLDLSMAILVLTGTLVRAFPRTMNEIMKYVVALGLTILGSILCFYLFFLSDFFQLMLSFVMVPQIAKNYLKKDTMNDEKNFEILACSSFFITLVFFRVTNPNLLGISTSYFIGIGIVIILLAQYFFLEAQHDKGPRFFIQNRKISVPSEFNSLIEMTDFGKEIVDENICSICLDELVREEEGKQEIIKTKCKHKFHSKCFFEWTFKKKECPICRSKLEKKYNGFVIKNFI